MTDDWPTVRLGDCVVVNDDTYSPKEAWPFINYLDTGNITMNRIAEIQQLDAAVDKVPSRARRKVRPGDIVYSMVRPNQRHFGIIKEPPENFLASTGFAVLRGKDGIADTGFLYWYLAQDHIVEQLHTIAEHSTSAYPSIRPADLEQLELRLPPMGEQRRIAGVLGCLDDKIELNRRMAATLEEMARALFRSWFVDFEPVRAKQEGRWRSEESLPGLPAQLYEAFPDRLEASALGPIPAGWRVAALGDVVEYVRESENPQASPDVLFDHHSIPAFDEDKMPVRQLGLDIKSAKLRVPPGTVLVSRLNPEIERVWLPDAQPDDRAICSTEFLVLRARAPATTAYVYSLARSRWFRDRLQSLATGTSKSHQRAQPEAVLGLQVPLPPAPVIDAFDERARGIVNGPLGYRGDASRVAALRDTLLPRLLSAHAEKGAA